MLGLLAPWKWSFLFVSLLGAIGVVLTVIAPKVLAEATNIIFEGYISLQLPAGVTQAQVVEGLRASGQQDLANIVEAATLTPGEGIDFVRLSQVVIIVLMLYVVASVLSWIQGYVINVIMVRAMWRPRDAGLPRGRREPRVGSRPARRAGGPHEQVPRRPARPSQERPQRGAVHAGAGARRRHRGRCRHEDTAGRKRPAVRGYLPAFADSGETFWLEVEIEPWKGPIPRWGKGTPPKRWKSAEERIAEVEAEGRRAQKKFEDHVAATEAKWAQRHAATQKWSDEYYAALKAGLPLPPAPTWDDEDDDSWTIKKPARHRTPTVPPVDVLERPPAKAKAPKPAKAPKSPKRKKAAEEESASDIFSPALAGIAGLETTGKPVPPRPRRPDGRARALEPKLRGRRAVDLDPRPAGPEALRRGVGEILPHGDDLFAARGYVEAQRRSAAATSRSLACRAATGSTRAKRRSRCWSTSLDRRPGPARRTSRSTPPPPSTRPGSSSGRPTSSAATSRSCRCRPARSTRPAPRSRRST